MQPTHKSSYEAEVSKWPSPALWNRRVHIGEPLVEARLDSVGDNHGKLPCSQHHTGSAEKPERDAPFCRFYHFVPPLRQLGLGSR